MDYLVALPPTHPSRRQHAVASPYYRNIRRVCASLAGNFCGAMLFAIQVLLGEGNLNILPPLLTNSCADMQHLTRTLVGESKPLIVMTWCTIFAAKRRHNRHGGARLDERIGV